MTQKEMFRRIAAVLYPGNTNWQQYLSIDLDVEPNTIRQWARGHTIISKEDIINDIINVLEDRVCSIDIILNDLENYELPIDNKPAA